MVRKRSFTHYLASSIIAATPEPSSLAPGASDLASITSVTLESRWPLMISTRSSLESVLLRLPLHFPVGYQQQYVVRLLMEIINFEVSRPFDSKAYLSNSDLTHCCAAPIPVFYFCIA
jgi:hypothetical protein